MGGRDRFLSFQICALVLRIHFLLRDCEAADATTEPGVGGTGLDPPSLSSCGTLAKLYSLLELIFFVCKIKVQVIPILSHAEDCSHA